MPSDLARTLAPDTELAERTISVVALPDGVGLTAELVNVHTDFPGLRLPMIRMLRQEATSVENMVTSLALLADFAAKEENANASLDTKDADAEELHAPTPALDTVDASTTTKLITTTPTSWTSTVSTGMDT